MKNKKKGMALLVTVLVLALLLISYFLLKSYNKEQEAETETESEVAVTQVNTDEVKGISYQYGQDEIAFEKEDDTWYYKGDKEFPVDQDSLTSLLENFADVGAERNLGKLESLSEYGLEEPTNVIRLTLADNSETVFYIGSKNDTTGTYYMYMDSPDTVYTISSTLVSAVDKGLYDFAKTETFPTITSAGVTSVDIQQKDREIKVYSMEDDSGDWKVTSTDQDEAAADSTKAVNLAGNVSSMYYQDFIDYNCKDLSKYGLDEPTLTLRVDYKETRVEETTEAASEAESESSTENTSESESETVKTISEKKDLTLVVGSQTEDGSYYVKLLNSDQVYTMSSDAIAPWLEASYTDLLKTEE